MVVLVQPPINGAPGKAEGFVGERTSKGADAVFAEQAETECSGLCEDVIRGARSPQR